MRWPGPLVILAYPTTRTRTTNDDDDDEKKKKKKKMFFFIYNYLSVFASGGIALVRRLFSSLLQRCFGGGAEAKEPAKKAADPRAAECAWVSRMGRLPASFWGSPAHHRLMWTVDPARVPPRRNHDAIRAAGEVNAHMHFDTPDGGVMMHWDPVRDAFVVATDRQVRQTYLILCAIRFARTYAHRLPDPDASLQPPPPPPSLRVQAAAAAAQQEKALRQQLQQEILPDVLVQMDKATPHRVVDVDPKLVASRAAAKLRVLQRAKAAAAKMRPALAVDPLADPDSLLIGSGGIRAYGWCPKMRALWTEKKLHSIVFTHTCTVGNFPLLRVPPRVVPAKNTSTYAAYKKSLMETTPEDEEEEEDEDEEDDEDDEYLYQPKLDDYDYDGEE